jgi:AcrR family transcriptional regulator
VLAAAAQLFATAGFAGTSISEIRELSGASASSIYREFGSKDGILSEVLEDSAARWIDQAGACAERAREEWEASRRPMLELYFENLADAFTERPEFLRLLLLLALERRDAGGETLAAVQRVRARAAAGFARGFREGGLVGENAPDELVDQIATATMAFADGAFVAKQINPDAIDLRRMFAIFYSGLVAALSVEGQQGHVSALNPHEGGIECQQ